MDNTISVLELLQEVYNLLGISRRQVVDGSDEFFAGLSALNYLTLSLSFDSAIQFQELNRRTNIEGNHTDYSFDLPDNLGTFSTHSEDRVQLWWGPADIDRYDVVIATRIEVERQQVSSLWATLRCGIWDNKVHFSSLIDEALVNSRPFRIRVPYYATPPRFRAATDEIPHWLNGPFIRQALLAKLTERDQVQKPLLETREDGAAEDYDNLAYKRNAPGQTGQRRGPGTYIPSNLTGTRQRWNY